ncbi:cation ABC transporter periplasmic cation-binding protein, partial [Pseudomonas amygdali pv. mori str. 301020]
PADSAILFDGLDHPEYVIQFVIKPDHKDDPRLAKQIAEASGAQPGGELYVEALSPADGPASTYAKMFRYNVDTLTAAMKRNQ